jgi:hypothetical protein
MREDSTRQTRGAPDEGMSGILGKSSLDHVTTVKHQLSHARPEMHPANIGQSDKFILGKHLSPNWLGRSQALISRHYYTVSRRFRLLDPRSHVTLRLDAVIGSKSAGCISGRAWDTFLTRIVKQDA